MQRFMREAAHVLERLWIPLTNPTSKFQPWFGKSPTSSQLIQVPHGVTAPAQLRQVPARLDQASSHSPLLASNTRLVVPPWVGASGGVGDSAPLFKYGAPAAPSWFRTSTKRSDEPPRSACPRSPSSKLVAMARGKRSASQRAIATDLHHRCRATHQLLPCRRAGWGTHPSVMRSPSSCTTSSGSRRKLNEGKTSGLVVFRAHRTIRALRHRLAVGFPGGELRQRQHPERSAPIAPRRRNVRRSLVSISDMIKQTSTGRIPGPIPRHR